MTSNKDVPDVVAQLLQNAKDAIERTEACAAEIEQDLEDTEARTSVALKEQTDRKAEHASHMSEEAQLKEQHARTLEQMAQLRNRQSSFAERGPALTQLLTVLERHSNTRKADLTKVKAKLLFERDDELRKRSYVEEIRAMGAARPISPPATEPESEDELNFKYPVSKNVAVPRQSALKGQRALAKAQAQDQHPEEVSKSIEVSDVPRPAFNSVVRSNDGLTSILSNSEDPLNGTTTHTSPAAVTQVRTSGRERKRPAAHEDFVNTTEAIAEDDNIIVVKREADKKKRRKTHGSKV
ncbi:hypothetical protein LTS10_002741 [Elasticomyces elasticus]|nr:hypothetical protein LTS10_002741 [Elasticomyces elasticus]